MDQIDDVLATLATDIERGKPVRPSETAAAFTKALKGYDRAQVDNFLQTVRRRLAAGMSS